jgi:hypothetical protein
MRRKRGDWINGPKPTPYTKGDALIAEMKTLEDKLMESYNIPKDILNKDSKTTASDQYNVQAEVYNKYLSKVLSA